MALRALAVSGSPREDSNTSAYLSAALDSLEGKTIKGGEVRIRRITTAEKARSCHIVFIGSRGQGVEQVLASLEGSSALTVGESEGFANRGGVVGFLERGNRIHFAINVDAAARARLKLSAKLVHLAEVVHE